MSSTNLEELRKIRKETLKRLYYLKALRISEKKVYLQNLKARINYIKEELETYQKSCNHPFLVKTKENDFSCLKCQKKIY